MSNGNMNSNSNSTLKDTNSMNQICPHDPLPILKTIQQMSQISGIGENSLRDMVRRRKIEYVRVGTKTLLKDDAIIEWYERNKRPVEHGQKSKGKKPVLRRKISNVNSATASQEQA